MIVGIDPGYSGAIASLDPGTRNLRVIDMPTLPGKKGKTILDYQAMVLSLIPPSSEQHVAMVEQVSAMPGQGVSSMFRFGQCYGALQAAVHGHGYEVHYVTPSQWKKYFGLSRDKGVSRGLAKERFPRYADMFSRVKDDGRAEAALLALYALETLQHLNKYK